MTGKAVIVSAGAGILGVAAVVWAGLWLWLLLSPSPLSVPVARYPVWPAACSTRGCVTFASWHRQQALQTAFADLTGGAKPTPAEALTTVLRRHLVSNAFLQSPITAADAARYREDVLHITESAEAAALLGVSTRDYDRSVIQPFLEQESLIVQNRAESTPDLYQQLANERVIILLHRHFIWDKNSGEATPRN